MLLVGACGPSDLPPTFDEIGEHEAFVGAELVIDLRASDPDGDVLTFGFVADSIPDLTTRSDPASIAALGTDGSQARFRWKPVARDVGTWIVDFEVTDGETTISESATITVKPEVGNNQSPTFIKPGGGSVDLDLTGTGRCLELEIIVEDPDSANVTISQEPVVQEGMRLEDGGPKRAEWRWCPTAAQIDAADRYRVHFSADDGVSNKSTKSLLVNLIKPQQMNCPGASPSITHAPADASTLDGIKISAQISDDRGLKSGSEPLLYYATVTPPTPIDLTNAEIWTSQVATLESGSMMSGTWAAIVPNPVADKPSGTSATIHYVWSAKDNDDATGDCDHTTYEPRTSAFQMKVTNPGGSGDQPVCTACTADAQCGGAADNCITIGDGPYCGKGCSGDGDCAAEYKCSEAQLSSVNGAMARQCVPRDGSCTEAPPTCADDASEPNDTLAMATSSTALDSATTYPFKVCPTPTGGADEDWYRVVVAGGSRELTFTLAGGSETDLDLQLAGMDGAAIGAPSASNGSNETLTRCVEPGTYYVRVYSSTTSAAEMSYGLGYTSVAKSCSAMMCTDDTIEDDDDLEGAVEIFLPLDGKFEDTERQICSGDDDWYTFELFEGEILYGVLRFTQTNAREDLDFHFHDTDGTDLTPCDEEDDIVFCDAANGQSATSNEYFEREITADGFYFLRVTGFDGAENDYEICLSVTEGECPRP